jgi:guanylate kinase
MQQAGEGAPVERPSGPKRAQRLKALGQANQVRSERAQIKAALRRGELRAAALLADPPKCLESASLSELLLAVPGVGQSRLRRVLNGCHLSPAKQIGRLTARQRHALAEALGALG